MGPCSRAQRRRAPLALGLALLPLAAVSSAPLSAQLTDLGGAAREADMLYMAGEPEAALDRLRDHLTDEPDDYGALWRAVRSAVVLAIREDDYLEQNAWLDPAIVRGDHAVELRPDGLDGIYWRGVAAGRRAMNAGPGYAVELAGVVYDDAHAILAVDSLHGGAHNMLGKLNFEVMSLSRIKRLIARTFMGNDALDNASWEDAEYHLRRAAELWPDFVLFHFDLARLYEKRGPRELAIRELAHALALPSVRPTDRRFQNQARELLEEWGVSVDTLAVDPEEGHGGG
jgi:tetratricopeptide (TPR) repeat protein